MKAPIVLFYLTFAFLAGCGGKPTAAAQAALDDKSWYIARRSGRIGPDGKPLNECVKSDKSPAEIMEDSRTHGIQYTVTDDGKDPPNIVLLKLNTSGDPINIFAFRGIIGCMTSKVITGIEVYDSSKYN